MSRRESDREDLLREATALVERAEIRIPGYTDPIVIGFRRDGSASFYFGADPVYQFNSVGELRRAYINGLLYKAERRQMVALHLKRSETDVALVRHELTGEEISALLELLQQHMERLQVALETGTHTLVGQVPDDCDIMTRIIDCLVAFSSSPRIANKPHVR
jgi:hypothetical protein